MTQQPSRFVLDPDNPAELVRLMQHLDEGAMRSIAESIMVHVNELFARVENLEGAPGSATLREASILGRDDAGELVHGHLKEITVLQKDERGELVASRKYSVAPARG